MSIIQSIHQMVTTFIMSIACQSAMIRRTVRATPLTIRRSFTDYNRDAANHCRRRLPLGSRAVGTRSVGSEGGAPIAR
jgi:hypothetical protein